MSKLYHYAVLALLATPFNIMAILCMKASHWIGSIGKPEKTHTYAQYIKATFDVKDELDKGVMKEWIDIAGVQFNKILEDERAKNKIIIEEYEKKIKQLEG